MLVEHYLNVPRMLVPVRTFAHVQNFFTGPAFSADSQGPMMFTSVNTTLFWHYGSNQGWLPTFPQMSENLDQNVMV